MKNVLLIGSELGTGGAERSISLLSYHLEKRYNVTLCILSGRNRKQYYKSCRNVVFIDPPTATHPVQKIKAWRYRIRKVKELKAKLKIDVSISFLEGPDYVNILTKGQEKVILSVRGSKIHDEIISGLSGILRKKVLIPRLYKKADQIICVTDALSRELKEYFKINEKSLKTIYNFYEEANIEESARESLSEDEERIFSKPVVISAGRLHLSKEQDKLIHIFSEISNHKPLRLILLGDGERKEELLGLCKSLNLTACDWQFGYRDADVYFMGFQQNSFKFYKRSKVFALTSSWEGFPNALAEALICKIPVVATDCHTGPREILNFRHHSEQPTTDPKRLAVGSLLPLLKQPTRTVVNSWKTEISYWLEAGPIPDFEFAKLTQRFSMDAVLRLWEEIIEY